METALQQLIAATPVGAVRARLAEGAPPVSGGVNAHIHLPPNFSAFDSVAEALDAAASEGVRVLGASNYYDYAVYAGFVRQAVAHGIYPLLGLEVVTRDADLAAWGVKVNDPGNPGKMYLCGKAITRIAPMPRDAQPILATIRRRDADRMAQMVDRIGEIFDAHGLPLGLTADDAVAMVMRRGVPRDSVTLQERHIAQAFQEALFAKIPPGERGKVLSEVFDAPYAGNPEDAAAVQGEIRARLMKAGRPGFVEESFVSPDDGKRMILALGGIPSYPTFADGGGAPTPFEADPQTLIARIRELGIHAAEFIPVRNSPETLAAYVPAMRSAGLVVTAGTEHNTRECIPLTPTAKGGAPLPPEVEHIFREGACVLAAHQYLTLNGEPGFVDATGAPNPAFPDAEARIKAFAALGAAVLATFFDQTEGL